MSARYPYWGSVFDLTQPILQGWTININGFNSASPPTEALVLSKFSYGRQLGRISDALAVIIEALPKTKAAPEIKVFLEMKAAVDTLK